MGLVVSDGSVLRALCLYGRCKSTAVYLRSSTALLKQLLSKLELLSYGRWGGPILIPAIRYHVVRISRRRMIMRRVAGSCAQLNAKGGVT